MFQFTANDILVESMGIVGVVGKLKVNSCRSKQNKIEKTDSQFVEAKGNVAIIFNSLKESLDDVTSLVQFSVENVFHLEV